MPTIRKLRVFLCHASQDKSIVRELRQRLEDEGWIDPWLAEKKLHPGEDWRNSIEEAVETSDLVVICLSKNSVDKEGFVQKELRYAREIALEKPEGTIFLIPLRVSDCDVPRGLRFFQWADYFGEQKKQAYAELLDSFSIRRQQVIRREEEKERKESEERERRAKEEIARKEAEERLRRQAEELANKLAEEKIRKDAEERSHKEALERIQKEAYEKARKEAEEKARLDAEVRVRKEAEERAKQKEQQPNRQVRPISVNAIVILVLACITLLAISLVLLSTLPSIGNLLKGIHQPTLVNSPVPSLTIPTDVREAHSSSRYILIPLTTAQQTDGTQAPGKVAVENLQLTPGYHILDGIPVDFQYEINTQNSGTTNYPQKISIPFYAQNPLAAYLLIQADWGYTRYTNQTIGKILINFNDATSYEYPLVMGENVRDWKRGDAPEAVTTITSTDVIYSWSGVAPDGHNGGIDLLRISIPAEYQNLSISSIDIVDTSFETTGDYDPGVRILAGSIEIQDTTPGPWEYQIERIPYSVQSLSWDLEAGEILILTGGSLQYRDYVCGGSGQQICILTITATNDLTVKIDSLVSENNWLAVSNSASPEEAVANVKGEFWLSPNCGNGCLYSTIAIFTNETLQNEYRIDNPNP